MRRTHYRYDDPDPPAPVAPNLAALARGLSDDELEAEILAKLGEPDYQLALLREHERRSKEA